MLEEKIHVAIISDNPVVYQRRVGAAYIGDAEVCSVDLFDFVPNLNSRSSPENWATDILYIHFRQVTRVV